MIHSPQAAHFAVRLSRPTVLTPPPAALRHAPRSHCSACRDHGLCTEETNSLFATTQYDTIPVSFVLLAKKTIHPCKHSTHKNEPHHPIASQMRSKSPHLNPSPCSGTDTHLCRRSPGLLHSAQPPLHSLRPAGPAVSTWVGGQGGISPLAPPPGPT